MLSSNKLLPKVYFVIGLFVVLGVFASLGWSEVTGNQVYQIGGVGVSNAFAQAPAGEYRETWEYCDVDSDCPGGSCEDGVCVVGEFTHGVGFVGEEENQFADQIVDREQSQGFFGRMFSWMW